MRLHAATAEKGCTICCTAQHAVQVLLRCLVVSTSWSRLWTRRVFTQVRVLGQEQHAVQDTHGGTFSARPERAL